MATLFDAMLNTAKTVSVVKSGTATGGSTTTLVDTSRTESNDYFNGGVLYFHSGNNAGTYAIVTNYDSTTYTFSFPTTLAAQAGDRYSAHSRIFDENILKDGINQALLSLGDTVKNSVTLPTVSRQESYDLPAGIRNILDVEIATTTAAPFDYVKHRNWFEADDDLFFVEGTEPTSTGMNIRLWYNAPHDELITATAVIESHINIDWLRYAASANCLQYRLKVTHGDEETAKMYGLMQSEAGKRLGLNPVKRGRRLPSLSPHLARLGARRKYI